jgi:hypothetical protein
MSTGVMWTRMDATIDSDPRARIAGFLGVVAYLAVLRQAKCRGRGGRVSASVADGAFLADLLRADAAFPNAADRLADGVEAAIRAGFLARDGGDILILDWHLLQPDPTNAKRQERFRENHADDAAPSDDAGGDASNGADRYTPEVTPTGRDGTSRDGTDNTTREGREEEPSGAGAPRSPPPDDVQAVWEHWKQATKHPTSKLDAKRKRLIAWAVKEYGVEQAKAAIDGCVRSPFHQGANDKGRIYDSVGLIFRDADHVDGFLAPTKTPTTAPSRAVPSITDAWADRAKGEPS